MTDGASAVLITKRSIAEKNKMPILAKFLDYVSISVEPEIYGFSPINAINKVLEK